jgi:tetratricopeptide (TPR) repeat protein
MRSRYPIRWLASVAFVVGAQLACSAGGPPVEYRSPAGVNYLAQPDTAGAVARAQSALSADPRNVDSILALGLAQAGIREYREAIATFTRGIGIEPNDPILYRWRGHRHLSVRELDSARADLDHGLSLDSTCYGCWYHLGIVKYVGGDFNGAADAFAHALPLAPDSGERAGSIDWSWMSLSRAGRAAEAQAVLDQHPDSLPEGYGYTQRIRLYRGAISPSEVVTPADTDGVQVATLSYGVGNWYLVRGDTARAREWFERSVHAADGWPAFGFIASEVELRRLR